MNNILKMYIKRYNELILENQHNICDGSKYFDFGGLNRLYTGYEHPIYYYINKRKIEKLEYIDPDVYLHVVSESMNVTYDETMVNIIEPMKVKGYSKSMLDGDKFPIGYYTIGNSMQEGRHRAAALLELGCKCMPIIVIDDNVSNGDVIQTVNELKDLSREEVNQIYIDKGYVGITDTDWRELEIYIKYRL